MDFKNKKVIYVTGETIPSFKLNGSTLATISLSIKLKDLGADLLAVTYDQTANESPAEIPAELKGYGIDLVVLKSNHVLNNGYFNEGPYQFEFQQLVDEFQPDIIICYDWSAVALGWKVKSKAYKISLTCDLRHIVIKERAFNYFRKNRSLISKFYNLRKSFFAYNRAVNSEVLLLKKFHLNINQAFHHCNWLQKKGAEVHYLPQFIKIPGSEFSAEPPSGKLKIMLAGNLSGVISIRGLEMMLNNIIPELKKVMGSNFEVNYFGKYDDSIFGPKLKKALNESSDVFVFKGFIQTLKDALLNHHIFIIPNNISLGFRTRIVEGMAYGACMLAHKANTYGMPELSDGENILISNTTEGFVKRIVEVYHNRDFLKQIRINSFNTYNTIYSVDVTIEDFIKKIK